MTIPGMSSHGLPPNWDSLARRIKLLERQINDVRTAPTLEAATIGEGGLTVKGGAIFIEDGNGNLLLTLDKDGLTATALGRIGNGSLAHPIQPGADFTTVNSTNMTTTGSDLTTASIPVPDGFDAATVIGSANVGNSRAGGAGPAPFYAQSWVELAEDPTGYYANSDTVGITCADGGSMSIAAIGGYYWEGLPAGSHINYGAWAAVDNTTGWTAGAANAHANLWVTFYRS